MKYSNPNLTRAACYLSFITQAIVNLLPALLFVTFQNELHISLTTLGMLTVINFTVQIFIDFLGAKLIDRISPRAIALTATMLCAVGLCCLGILPRVISPLAGVIIAMIVNAAGGGMIEVMASPLIEALPSVKKSASMSLLHSFYCWGCTLVVLLSTLYFGSSLSWNLLPVIWAIVPFIAFFCFLFAPIYPLGTENSGSILTLIKKPVFWVFLVLMLCAGAAEQAMAQWASYFAQVGLQVPKSVGDLAGPCAFSVLMGIARLSGARKKSRVTIRGRLIFSAALCCASYLLAVFAPSPALSLAGCALCGFAIGAMWPGTFSLTAEYFPNSGGMLFALLALAGDIGCASGPGLIGVLSDAVQKASPKMLIRLWGETTFALKFSLLLSVVFPLCMLLLLLFYRQRKENHYD